MARYIDAVQCADVISEKLNIPLGDLVDVFAGIPTSDVVEVKRGEWLEVDSDVGWELVRCSLCGKEQSLFQDEEKPLYCSHCGSKMSVNYKSSKNER